MFSYGYENLKNAVQTETGKRLVEFYRAEYEKKYLGSLPPQLKYSDYKLIYINGDRHKYQEVYFEKVTRLMMLQVLAISDDKYLSELEDLLACICDEFTWVLPAHNLNKDNTFDYTIIDLFSAERAFALAETVCVFQDKLTVDIRNRIKIALQSKIIDNYESRRFLWDDCTHNWAAVCSCGVGLTYLYMFPEKFPAVKDRIFNSMRNYINGVNDDGVVTEGIGYLDYGFGMFCVFHDVYVQLTGEIPETLKDPKIEKILQFAANANLGGGLFLPFADGGFKWHYSEACIHYAIKNLFKDKYELPLVNTKATYTKALSFRILHGAAQYGGGSNELKNKGTTYYPDTGVYIHKKDEYVFVAKCGHNCEAHNHNDVGCFELIKNGEKIISDLGAGRYTWKYHNDHTLNGRYGKEIFVCGSWGHSVPILNDTPQVHYIRSTGEPYGGEIIEATECSFKADIAKAYEDGNADSLTVEYLLKDKSVCVNYQCKGVKENVVFRFITEQKPIVEDGKVILGAGTLISKSNLTPTIEKVFYEGHQAQSVFGLCECYTVDFKVNESGDIEESFEIVL